MVGKVKRARHKLHSAAVKLTEAPAAQSTGDSASGSLAWPPLRAAGSEKPPFGDASQWSTSIFAGTIIDPKLLVKNLDIDDCKSVVSVKKGEKTQLSKKEKMKQRHERWLQKIDAIKLTEQKKKAQKKRKATPVVGDMQPLADALPELSDLISGSKVAVTKKSKIKSIVAQPNSIALRTKQQRLPMALAATDAEIKQIFTFLKCKKKPEPTLFSKMHPAQKRKLIDEEVTRFRSTIVDPTFKANPLAAVTEHLLKRMRQEAEELI